MTTTNFPNGVNNNTKQNILGSYTDTDPTANHTYFTDFDDYRLSNWTVTVVGTSTQALTDEDGGVLLVTNSAADDDSLFAQNLGEDFQMEAGKQAYFKARFKVSDATQSDLVMGLQITDTTPLDASDGIFFRKDDGDTNLDFVVVKDSTASTAIATTLSDDTYITVAFFYNGDDKIIYAAGTDSKNPTIQGSLDTTNLPDDEVLTVSYGVQNGEAVAKTMSIDYIFAAKER